MSPHDLPPEVQIGEAWEALPDDLTGDHATLADAIRALVDQRDLAQIELRRAWDAIPDEVDSGHPTLADAVWSLIRERDAYRASADGRFDGAHLDGYRAALDDVAQEMESSIASSPRDRWQYLWGWITGRRAGL